MIKIASSSLLLCALFSIVGASHPFAQGVGAENRVQAATERFFFELKEGSSQADEQIATNQNSGSLQGSASIDPVGASISRFTSSGPCGMTSGQISERGRKAWHSEAQRSGQFPDSFQTDADLRRLARSTPVPASTSSLCEATQKQTQSLIEIGNQTLQSAIAVSGYSAVKLDCGGPLDGAYGATACLATQQMYAIQTNAKFCQITCGLGR